jgi:hypothetical protein
LKFKWLSDPNNPESRNREIPSIVAGIKQYKRKEESIYKPSDLWTEEEDLLFLKYCDNARNRCYHMVSRDTACRPSELLNIKLIFFAGQACQFSSQWKNPAADR